MPPSHLKIMIQISDHSIVEFVELTSDMLEYNGKLKLEKYLIFDPTIKFNSALKQKILELSYDKKVEIFFNTQTFDRKIVNSIELKQDEGKQKHKLKKEKSMADVSKIIKTERDQANASFEFIIQCIFCTGLPLSNYYKTMEFYDVEASKHKVIAKRSSSVFDFINPTPFKQCFSYIKLKGKKYTVTGLTWINDVLNHPVYMDIIKKYKKYDHERKKVDPSKNEKELNTKLNSLILDIYDLDIYDISFAKISEYDSSRHKVLLESRNKIQMLFKNIKEIKTSPTLFHLDISNSDANEFINGYPKIKAEYDKEKTPLKKPHRLRELIITYNGLISNPNHTQIEPLSIPLKDSLSNLKNIIEGFDNNTDIKRFKSEIKNICSIYADNDFNETILNTNYYPSLIKYFRTLKLLFLKEDMYEIILNDLTYQDRNPSEIQEMNSLIEKEVKNYYDYRQAFKHIDEDRVISNTHWKKEADIINGEAGVIESSDLKKKESLFEIILKCDKNNKACVKQPVAVPYLEIGLEQINRKDKTSFTYEAYINLEVAEGVYNESNYYTLMCPYINNVLGDSYDEMIRKEEKNIIMRNRIFVKANPPPTMNNNSNKKPNQNKSNHSIKHKRPKRKSGGTKKKRRTKKNTAR